MAKKVGECRFCRKTKKLVDSHVVPKALHLDVQPDDDVMKIYSKDLAYGKRSPSGVFGQFLCQHCERSFSNDDKYGVDFVKTYKGGRTGARLCESFEHGFTADVDYAKLKLWVMSMLWRADACDHELFSRVNLGDKWRDSLAESIRSRTPGCVDYFAVTATLFNENDYGKKFIADPHLEKYKGINYYRFYVYGGFTFFIKVDKRKQSKALEPLSLKEGESFAVLRRKFSEGERERLRDIAAGTSHG